MVRRARPPGAAFGLPLRRILLLLLSAFPLHAGAAGPLGPADPAAAVDGLGLRVSLELRDEDNPFRLAPQADARSLLGTAARDDQVHVLGLGLRYDKTWSRQRLELAADASAWRYRTHSQFDFYATGYLAAWHWQWTPVLSGLLQAGRQQSLRNYADFSNFSIRNVFTEESRRAALDWSAGGGWHASGALTEHRARNSDAAAAAGDDVRRGGELGVRWVSPADNVAALLLRQAHGRYEGRVPNPFLALGSDFDDREVEARLDWKVGSATRLDARAGWLARRHETFPERDFSGPVGRIAANWAASGKVRVRLGAGRQLSSFQELANSYYVARDVEVAPRWQASARTGLELRWVRTERDYRGALLVLGPQRQDEMMATTLTADWNPGRRTRLAFYWQRERRDSNYEQFVWRARTLGLRLEMSLG